MLNRWGSVGGHFLFFWAACVAYRTQVQRSLLVFFYFMFSIYDTCIANILSYMYSFIFEFLFFALERNVVLLYVDKLVFLYIG